MVRIRRRVKSITGGLLTKIKDRVALSYQCFLGHSRADRVGQPDPGFTTGEWTGMDWITDQIAIGNFLDAESQPPDVEIIICLKPGCCAKQTTIETLHFPLVDGAGNNPALYRRAVTALAKAVDAGKRVLVHCHAGRSRSVVVVAKYLMDARGISSDEALALIGSKREIYLTQGIEEAFRETRKVGRRKSFALGHERVAKRS